MLATLAAMVLIVVPVISVIDAVVDSYVMPFRENRSISILIENTATILIAAAIGHFFRNHFYAVPPVLRIFFCLMPKPIIGPLVIRLIHPNHPVDILRLAASTLLKYLVVAALFAVALQPFRLD